MLTGTNDRIMNKAVFILKQMSEDEKLREAARIRERALHDEASYLQDAMEEGIARGIEQGMARGIEQGMARGIEQGMAQGIEQGMAQATNDIMERLRSLGVDEETLRRAVKA